MLAVSRQLSRNLSGMSAGGIIIRQLGSLKIGNDFPAVVQVKKIARHDEPRYEKRFLAAFDRIRKSPHLYTGLGGGTSASSEFVLPAYSIDRVDPSYGRIAAPLQTQNRQVSRRNRKTIRLPHHVCPIWNHANEA
jgi:hypothetical protein